MQNKNNSGMSGEVYGHRVRMPTRNDVYYPTDSLDFAGVPVNARLHPAEKPVPLLEYLIKTYTNEGMTVLDNCMGSGSTGVACVNTGRDFIGFELDEKYFDIAKNRIEDSVQELKRFRPNRRTCRT